MTPCKNFSNPPFIGPPWGIPAPGLTLEKNNRFGFFTFYAEWVHSCKVGDVDWCWCWWTILHIEMASCRGEIDDIAFKKKQMHSGWWGLSRRQSVCYNFLLPYPPSNITIYIAKSSNTISSIEKFYLLILYFPSNAFLNMFPNCVLCTSLKGILP